MEKEIKLDIVRKKDLLEKYDESKASREVVEYLIQAAMLVDESEKIKVIINMDSEIDEKAKELVIEGLKDEFKRSKRRTYKNNVKQIYLFFLGIFLLFLSMLISKKGIWKEILLISGWVPIWEMIEMELFPDAEARIRRKIIKRLLESDIVENKIWKY